MRINRKARIIICGAISQYNNTSAVQGPKNYLSPARQPRAHGGHRRVRLRAALRRGGRRDGRLPEGRPHEEPRRRGRGTVADFPATLLKLFNGENFGKLVLQLAD
jgi:NADPH-dependent curcumin reductase CurA